jgi:hypothetical protein
MELGRSFDPARREERFAKQLDYENRGITFGNIRSRLRQAEAFADGNVRGYAPQDPHEIVADVLSLLRHLGMSW